jgi:hypothetical protein
MCRECGVALPAKTTAVYDFNAKNVLCLGCRDATAQPESHLDQTVDLDKMGADNRREADRRVGERRRPTESNDDATAKLTRVIRPPSSLPVG